MLGGNGTYELLESAASYTGNFGPENDVFLNINNIVWSDPMPFGLAAFPL